MKIMAPRIEKEKKEDRDAPAFDFYPERWITGTAHMTDAEQISYLRLLCHQWTMDGLPCDEKVLRRLGGRGVTATVLEKFPTLQGRRRNRRLELIRAAQRERIRNKSEQSRNAANKRWDKTAVRSNAGAYADVLRAECPPPTTHLPPQEDNHHHNNDHSSQPAPSPGSGLGFGFGLGPGRGDEIEFGMGSGFETGAEHEHKHEHEIERDEPLAREQEQEEEFSLELALRYAASYGKEEGTGAGTGSATATGPAPGVVQSITAEQVHAWYDDRSKVGWVLVKGGEPLPVRAWKADLRSYVRAWESLDRARPIKPKSSSRSGDSVNGNGRAAGGGSAGAGAGAAGSRTQSSAPLPPTPGNPPSVWSLQQQIEAVEKEKASVKGQDMYKNLPLKRKVRYDRLCDRLRELNALLTGVPLDAEE